jgi:HD-like signal output (HDOD) protein
MALLRIFKRADDRTAVALDASSRARAGLAPPLAAAAARPLAQLAPLPAELTAYRPIRAEQLDGSSKQALIKLFQNIPRPPRLLHRLLSPEFVAEASTSELSDMIVAEPLLAVQLLKTINSPMYGLRTPVARIDQAIKLLGLADVRGLCLRYLMVDAFKADSPERQQLLDATWQSSALASEITLRLAQGLGYVDPGGLVSQTVLTFLGRLATVSGMPRGLLAKVPARGMLERSAAEQSLLGLSSAEIGRLLMHEWELPQAISDEAAEVDAVLFAPYAAWEPVRASRLALSYLAVRLGERLAYDPAMQLEDFDLLSDPDPEMHQLRGYLDHPAFAGVCGELAKPSFLAAVRRTREALGSAA